MRSVSALAVVLVVACSDGEAHSRAILTSAQVFPDSATDATAGKEAVPAEWTVAEDTAASGEITTASVQLPTSRAIEGLPGTQPSRLILRCLNGRVAAFISGAEMDSSTSAALVSVELDSAPPCE